MARVLIADDNENTRLLVRTVLEHAGHTVIEAETGTQALAATASSRPDLILLDLSMPAMSGSDFMRALRSDPKINATAVALYTATPRTAVVRDFMQIYGIAHVVPKPSEPVELIAAVERALVESQAEPNE